MNKDINSNPLLYFEKILWAQGLEYIAGIDEVGLGALAGPVVASAVIFPKDIDLFEVKDSKKLTSQKRESLYLKIKDKALFIGIGKVNVAAINKTNNIYKTGLEAMKRAVCSLKVKPQHILVDGRKIPDIKIPQSRFDKGDNINFSIAAASIVAKVYRDNLMKNYSNVYPNYLFHQHKGYATGYHVEILKKIGPCKIHRVSYEFVKGICGDFSKRYFKIESNINKAGSEEEMDRIDELLMSLRDKISQIEFRRLKRKIQFKKNNLIVRFKRR